MHSFFRVKLIYLDEGTVLFVQFFDFRTKGTVPPYEKFIHGRQRC